MGSTPKPPPPAPPPPVPRAVDAAAAGDNAMDDERRKSAYLNSFLAQGKKKNSLGTGPTSGPSFLGSNS